MGGAKPWQIALIALAIVVLLGSLAWRITHSESVNYQQEFVLVDVETGELFKVHRPSDRSLPTPAMNPVTERITLFPAAKDGETWIVPEQYRKYLEAGMPAVEDISSGRLKATGEPKFLDLFKGS